MQLAGHVQHREAERMLFPAIGQAPGDVAEYRLVDLLHPGPQPGYRAGFPLAVEQPEPRGLNGTVEPGARIVGGEDRVEPPDQLIDGLCQPVGRLENDGLVADPALDALQDRPQLAELGLDLLEALGQDIDVCGVPGPLQDGRVHACGPGHAASPGPAPSGPDHGEACWPPPLRSPGPAGPRSGPPAPA